MNWKDSVVIFFALACLCFGKLFAASMMDLEANSQDFVLEVKKLEIPGYPEAFNPSIVRWNGGILMSFRVWNPDSGIPNQVGTVWLDEDMNVKSQPSLIDLKTQFRGEPNYVQDPRLVVVGDRLLMVYNNLIPLETRENRRMHVAELEDVVTRFTIERSESILNYPDAKDSLNEKNWVPFDWKGDLLLGYSIVPHRILRPVQGTNTGEWVSEVKSKIKWNWGILRGGTPALKIGNKYLSFFHSWKHFSTIHSDGEFIPHCFIGAYTFSADPPFEIEQISPNYITGKSFYDGPPYVNWRPLRVFYPCGYIIDGDYIWLSCGKQDHEAWVVKIDKHKLLNSLVNLAL